MLSLKEFTCASLTQDLPYSFLKPILLKDSVMIIVADFKVKCQLSGKQCNVLVLI